MHGKFGYFEHQRKSGIKTVFMQLKRDREYPDGLGLFWGKGHFFSWLFVWSTHLPTVASSRLSSSKSLTTSTALLAMPNSNKTMLQCILQRLSLFSSSDMALLLINTLPIYRPDPNPIEHVWVHLKRYLHRKYPDIANTPGGPDKYVLGLLRSCLKPGRQFQSPCLNRCGGACLTG